MYILTHLHAAPFPAAALKFQHAFIQLKRLNVAQCTHGSDGSFHIFQSLAWGAAFGDLGAATVLEGGKGRQYHITGAGAMQTATGNSAWVLAVEHTSTTIPELTGLA